MPAAQPDQTQVIAVALAYAGQVNDLRQRLSDYIERLWVSLGVYRADQMVRFINEVIPTVAGAQQQVAALTAAYLAQERHLVLGGTVVPVALDPKTVTGSAVRGGADPAQVYERPFHLVWRQLDALPRQSGSIDQAIKAGLDRAKELALDDVQLAKRAAGHQIVSADRHTVGYRRVLEGTYSCGLCIVASTQRYHKKTLLPIHGKCDCGVLPIYGDEDDEGIQVIDPETLENVHQRILDRFGVNARDARAIPGKDLPDYRRILVTHQHGELGAVLGVLGEPFTGPDDLDIAA